MGAVLHFGKHRGQPLEAVPKSYLQWLLANATNLRPETKAAIRAVLDGKGTPREPGAASETGPVAPARHGRPGPRGARPLVGKPPASAAPVLCDRCGLAPGGTPMVHLACVDTTLPF